MFISCFHTYQDVGFPTVRLQLQANEQVQEEEVSA